MRTSTAFLVFSLLVVPAMASACDKWAAMVVSVNGYVVMKSGGESSSDSVPLKPDSVICPGQQLEVGANSRAAIYLSNNSFVRLDENTVMSFPAVQSEESFWVELKQGVSHFISRITMRFGVKTAYTNAVVDGTEFIVTANSDNTQVSVVEGTVTVTIGQRGINVPVHAGQGVIVDSSPEFKRIELSATDSVDWAIYFPPLVIVDELDSQLHQSTINTAANYLQRSRPDLAIRELEAIPEPDAAVAVALATSYMAVGDTEGAERSIKNTTTPQAQALRSLIAVVINQPKRALELAKQQNNQILSSKLALSYAYQANLDLPSALEVAREATEQYPQDYMAWVRLSEMQVAMGDVGSARDSIAKAKDIAPDDSAVLVQSAFVDMFNNRFQKAEKQFQQALALYSENPQARLGLGLVLLRQGDLEAGRKQIEYAVSLDPARSVLRSYLGRAYFEEKRDDESAVQWDLAKQLDPEDPTAYFYDGVRKLYGNDPIGALGELEKSLRLSGERALYRSDSLLQSDEASRSAALAATYEEIGYSRGVHSVGWEALKKDPASPVGHRLLADNYRGNSRYESARASELLQSQLLQPITAFPLQPQLSETGISFVEGAGPQRPGYNEYHSLFTQDGIYGALNGYGGSDGTWGDDLVGSFLSGPLAVSLGQYHFESDGWRENSDQEQDVYSGFAQWQVTSNISMQAEYRKLSWDFGDLAPELVTFAGEVQGEQLDRETQRFGLIYRSSSKNTLILSVANRKSEDQIESSFGLVQHVEIETSELDSVELQDLFSTEDFSWISGVSYFDLTEEGLQTDNAISQVNPVVSAVYSREGFTDDDPEIVNLYSYLTYFFDSTRIEFGLSYAKINRNVSVDVEQSFLFVDGDGNVVGSIPQASGVAERKMDFSDFSPKVGLIWHRDRLELKAALFQSVRYLPKLDQSIEPTMFSGFMQLYEENFSSVSENAAIGFDYALGEGSYLGGDYVRRYIEFDEFYVAPQIAIEERKIEYYESLAKLHYYNTLSPNMSFSLSANWERMDYKELNFAFGRVSFIDRYSVPFTLDLFSDEQVSFRLEQVYHKQRYKENDSSPFTEDNTWVTNLSVKRRLGESRGSVSVGVQNLLDEESEFVNYDASTLQFYPARFWYAALNFSL